MPMFLEHVFPSPFLRLWHTNAFPSRNGLPRTPKPFVFTSQVCAGSFRNSGTMTNKHLKRSHSCGSQVPYGIQCPSLCVI
jgi:hypothetical protein